MEIEGFCFPNDIHINWTIMIVMYPYVTGLVAGAFMVSSLYHVFGRMELRPVSRLSLVTSLGFLLFAPLTLLNHLGHPERALNIVFTPNLRSAMSAFGLVYTVYLIVVALEIWLAYRRDIVVLARKSQGIKRNFFMFLALGIDDISSETARIDRRTITVLAAVGIPLACLLHGYVGFIFGAVKANPWWSTPLMPIIFLSSAIVSGISMIVVLYQTTMKFMQGPIESACVQSLCRWLWLFAILTVTLESLEIITLAYERAEEWEVIGPLLGGRLAFSFIGIQMVFGALVPIILLGVVVLMNPYLSNQLRNTLSFVASLLLLVQVFAMRWNVVIGGQTISKSMRGFREPYHPEFLEKEGLLVAILIFALPLIFVGVFNKILPVYEPREDEVPSEGAVLARPERRAGSGLAPDVGDS